MYICRATFPIHTASSDTAMTLSDSTYILVPERCQPSHLDIFLHQKVAIFAFIAIKFAIFSFLFHNESLTSAYKIWFYSVITWVGIMGRRDNCFGTSTTAGDTTAIVGV